MDPNDQDPVKDVELTKVENDAKEILNDAENEITSHTVPTRLRIGCFSKFLGENVIFQSLYGASAGFFLYFCMYALRKPLKAATFQDENGDSIEWFNTGMSLKTALILFQLVGYLISKWLAVKVTSEAKGKQDLYLFGLYVIAESSLVLFGLMEPVPNYSVVALLLNGLNLGMVWGLVVLYFEGRNGSDFMLVCLCISFIVSSGVVKDVALLVLDMGISEFWMPAMVGAFFGPLYLLCIVLLNQLPEPSKQEMLDKGDRVIMTHQSRWNYFVMFWPGLLCLWIAGIFLTAYRDYRDSFAVEIFQDMGFPVVPGTLSSTESIVAGVLLIPIASLVFCKNNVIAFGLSMGFLMTGAIILLVSVYTFLATSYDSKMYFIISGVGSYLAYVPYNSVLFERLIAVLHQPCTVSYLMAVFDALGYLGVFVIFLVAEYAPQFSDHLDVYNKLGQSFGWIMLALYVVVTVYFFVYKKDTLFVKGGVKLHEALLAEEMNGTAKEVHDDEGERLEAAVEEAAVPSHQ